MLNVDYTNPIGWYKMLNADNEIIKVSLCHANCLWAEMNFYTLEKDCRLGKKGQKMAELVGFAGDIQHLENICKALAERRNDADGDQRWIPMNYHFYAEQMNDDLWDAVQVLAKYGNIVTIL